MTRKAFLSIAWNISETIIQGPYVSKEVAQDANFEDILGTDYSLGIIGPIPFEQVITNGEWGDGEAVEADRSVARQWAVFEVPSGDLRWITFGDDSELEENFNFHWIGNYEGETPAEAYRQASETGGPKAGHEFVAVPVGTFGPSDWMRVAGDMLTKVQG